MGEAARALGALLFSHVGFHWWELLPVGFVAVEVGIGVVSWRSLSWRWFWHLTIVAAGVAAMCSSYSPLVRVGYVLVAAGLLLITSANFSVRTLRVVSVLVAVVSVVMMIRVGQGPEARDLAALQKETCHIETPNTACDPPTVAAFDAADIRSIGSDLVSLWERRVAAAEATVAAASSALDGAQGQLESLSAVPGITPADPLVAAVRTIVRNDTLSLAQANTQLAAARGNLLAIQQRVDATRAPTVVDLAASGADEIVTSMVNRWTGGTGDIAIGVVGWIGFLIVAVFVHRRLEIISNRREIGPVAVDSAMLRTAPTDQAVQPTYISHRMRDVLARAAVWEPAAVPTAEVDATIASVLSADPLPATKLIGSAFRVLVNVLVPRPGYVALPTYHGEESGLHALTVTLREARRNRLVTSRTFHARSLNECIDRAACYVGEFTLSHADVVPPWSPWPDEQWLPLQKYLSYKDALDDGESDEVTAQRIREAFLANTGSPLLRMLMGLQHEVNGQLLDAIACYRVASAGPGSNFIQAHFRHAVALGVFASYAVEEPGVLDRALADARTHIAIARRKVSVHHLVVRAICIQDERTANLALLGSRNRRRHLLKQIRAAQLVIELRQLSRGSTHAQLDRLRRSVDKLVAHAGIAADVVLYMAATFYALMSQGGSPLGVDTDQSSRFRKRAIELLEQALTTPGVEFPRSSWIKRDPDLVVLHAEPTFLRFLSRYHEAEVKATPFRYAPSIG